MILDELNIPGLAYEIFEADDRFGGRVHTHRFSDVKHDYYDVGAMRFPKIEIMEKCVYFTPRYSFVLSTEFNVWLGPLRCLTILPYL